MGHKTSRFFRLYKNEYFTLVVFYITFGYIVTAMNNNPNQVSTDEINSLAQLDPRELAEYDRWLAEKEAQHNEEIAAGADVSE